MTHNLIDPIISEYFSKLGKKAGEVNKAKGAEYFSRIGKLGVEKRRQNKAKKEEVL